MNGRQLGLNQDLHFNFHYHGSCALNCAKKSHPQEVVAKGRAPAAVEG
jgi:hypothetical protein